jgi:PKD repeat protein
MATFDMDGSDLKPLPRSGYRPRWSPDGRKLAFDDIANLYTANADGSDIRQVTQAADGEQHMGAVWTPDGDKILVDYWRLRSHDYNAVVDAETGEKTKFGLAHGQLCEFSADGTRLVAAWNMPWTSFSLSRADGTETVHFQEPFKGATCLSLSPDGRYGVATKYRSDSDSRIDVVVFDLQTKQVRNLTNGEFGGYNEHPTWSPTGEWIIWGSNKDRGGATGFGSTDIWRIRPDGTGAQKIVDAGPSHFYRFPDVQPLRGVAPEPEPTLSERKPDARVAAATGVEGAQITLDASGSRPGADDAAITSYGWDLDGDGVYTDAEGVAPKTSFEDEGTYTVAVLVTDAAGKAATATAEVTVTNAGPAIAGARIDDGKPAGFGARITDPGTADVLTATVFWNGAGTGETVPVIASGDGFVVLASRPGATSAKVVVSDGDGGEAEAAATRVRAPANGAPSAENAGAAVVAGEAVDIDLPARDPEGELLEFEIVDQPSSGSVQMREPSPDPTAPDVTYAAGEQTGPVTFTYRVTAGGGKSSLATVTIDVTPRPDDPGQVVVPHEPPIQPDQPPVARPAREGASPVDQAVVDELTGEAPKVITKAEQVATLPPARSCVSRRNFRIRVKRGDYRKVTVRVNGKRVKVLRGLRDTAMVDLRGLPKGRFKVQIAVTLNNGKVVRSARQYRTGTPQKSKKGGRA